jgi:hypothetical protein
MDQERRRVLMARESLAEEIGELARIALDFGQRHNVPIGERLDYHRRKAVALGTIAERDGSPNTREIAELAWRYVRELEAEQAGGEPEPGRFGKHYGYRLYANGSHVVGPIPREQVLKRMRNDKGVVPVERPGIPGAWRPWTDSAELAREAEQATDDAIEVDDR